MKLCIAILALFSLLGLGCGGGNDAPLSLRGTVDTTAAAGLGRVVAVWVVSSGSPDYAFKFGEGTAKGQTFTFSLAGEPPAEALNSGQIGVGILVLIDPSVVIPDGKITAFNEFQTMIRGQTPRQALIWRKSGEPKGLGWVADFPAGLSCGQCAPPASGNLFEQYQKMDCSAMKILTTSSSPMPVCNWT